MASPERSEWGIGAIPERAISERLRRNRAKATSASEHCSIPFLFQKRFVKYIRDFCNSDKFGLRLRRPYEGAITENIFMFATERGFAQLIYTQCKAHFTHPSTSTQAPIVRLDHLS